MKYLLFLLVACVLAVAEDTQKYDELLDQIEDQAIVIGEGDNRVYAFIDPMCPNSVNYFNVIYNGDHLRRLNTYYIFLYRMQKYKSDRLIEYIYDAADIKAMMKMVMIDGFKPKLDYFAASKEAQLRKKTISDIADQFGAKRRPYILLYKAGSPYCKVSEGTAPCLEEK